MPLKRLGDPVYTPNSQNVGCVAYDYAFEDLETFARLARGYKVGGRDRAEICRFNASVSQIQFFVGNVIGDTGLVRIRCGAT